MKKLLNLFFFCLAITSLQANDFEFTSSWEKSSNRVWVGENFWAKPLQDWRVQNGKLECIQQNKPSLLHLLTHQITDQTTFVQEITISKTTNKGSAGFIIASHGNINDYRHNCVWGKGIHAGIDANGELFIDGLSQTVKVSFDQQITLISEIKNGTLSLYTKEAPSKKLRYKIPTGKLKGNLAIFAEAKSKKRQHTFSFSNWRISGQNLAGSQKQSWGPILWSQYTLSKKKLKVSVQMVPLAKKDNRQISLEIKRQNTWKKIASAEIEALSSTALFRLNNWDDSREIPYRFVYELKEKDSSKIATYEGIFRRDPIDKQQIKVAGFTGNKDYGFPNSEIVNNVTKLNPDLLFFSGDQIYETVGGYNITRGPLDLATLDYLGKWYLFGWSFGDLMRNRPSVAFVDDHDVYQGNVWGGGGRKVKHIEQGGFIMPAPWVNMVQRTQTSHMPDYRDNATVDQNIGVYFTDMVYGRISFALIEDRKFKSGPRQFGKKKDSSQAILLGERQLNFIRDWTADWRGADMKATLSATAFAQCHTHGGPTGYRIKKDKDANGWPQEPRDKAMREIRKGFAFMFAGDNHLPTIAHHGIDDFEDAGISFTVPSIAAGFPRAWLPKKAKLKRFDGFPNYLSKDKQFDYTGRVISDFGHHLTMLAAANPKLYRAHKVTTPGDIDLLARKASGFGMATFDKKERTIKLDCWRIDADLNNAAEGQFPGWPMTFSQEDNYGRKAIAWLPTLQISGIEKPVLQIFAENSGEMIYAIRLKSNTYQAKVFAEGSYTIKIGDQENGHMKTLSAIKAESNNSRTLKIEF